jgi:hypothetical protein
MFLDYENVCIIRGRVTECKTEKQSLMIMMKRMNKKSLIFGEEITASLMPKTLHS